MLQLVDVRRGALPCGASWESSLPGFIRFRVMLWGHLSPGQFIRLMWSGFPLGSVAVQPVVSLKSMGDPVTRFYSASLLFSRFLEEWATSAGD